MKIEVRKYTKELIQDVIDFEKRLREEETFETQKIYYLSLCDLADVYPVLPYI